MFKRFLAFLIFLALSVPPALASSTSCPSSTAGPSLDLEISALYPNPNSGEEEWIELKNTGESTLNLADYTLEDATAHPWALSGTLEAGETVEISGFSFQLNNSNETVTLKTSTGTIVDTWTYASSTKGEVLNRGDSESTGTETSTPSTTQTISPSPTSATATPSKWPAFSEALPNPAGSDSAAEWIELYNPYAETLSLNGLKLDDEDGGSSPHALNGTLAGESYLLLPITDTNITLNNTEDHVRLLGVTGEILWDIPYSGGKEDQSYALLSGTYAWTDNPTPGEENEGPNAPTEEDDSNTTSKDTPDPSQNGDLSDEVAITEVFPNPEGTDNQEEWIELTNNGDETVNLGNWTLRDASGATYTFPGGTTVAPGETLLIYRPESKISLNNSNESLELNDYNGETVSEVSYESSEEDESYAEIQVEASSSTQASTSGLGSPSFSTWQWVDPSPGAKNPVWKQIKGLVSEWDGQYLTMNDGLSNWTFEADNTEQNSLLFQVGNQVLVQAALQNGIYLVMHSELVENAATTPHGSFPWSWLLAGLAGLSWAGYELYKKRKKTWTLPPQALN